MYRLWLLPLIALCLVSCGTLPASPAPEMIDEKTGNTVTVVARPIVFARDRTDVAAHARDYATLVAVEIDRSGNFKDFLLVYRWSTVDKRMSPPPGSSMGDLKLLGDGRVIELQALDSVPVGIQAENEMHLPRHGAALVHAYLVDHDLLRFIAASRTLTLQLPQESLDTPFNLWKDGRAELDVFLHQTSAPD
jgi:hypothetical protein